MPAMDLDDEALISESQIHEWFFSESEVHNQFSCCAMAQPKFSFQNLQKEKSDPNFGAKLHLF